MAENFLIHGYYGLGNLGDDAMLAGLIHSLDRYVENARIRVLVPGNGLRELLPEWPFPDVPATIDQGPRSVARAVRGSEMLIFGGGTCFHERGACALPNLLVARALLKKTALIGVGMGVFRSKKARLRARLSLMLATHVTWRDPVSAREARTWFGDEGTTTEDLAFLLHGTPILEPRPCGGSLVVSWRVLGALGPIEYGRLLREGARGVARAAAELGCPTIVVLNAATHVDGDANQELARVLVEEGDRVGVGVSLRAPASLGDKISVIARARAYVSMRMHGWILAKMLGVPAVGLSYSPKFDRFARLLNEPRVIHLPELRSNAERLIPEIVSAEAREPSEFRDAPEVLRAAAHRNIEMLADT